MAQQINLFEGFIPYYKITKPVRLIELFAGIGSQHQALKNLGVKIDNSTIVEWQINSIQAYNDIHVRKYDDHTQNMSKEDVAKALSKYGVSIDYNQPAKLETLLRKSDEWLRNVYNNVINTNNKVNIMSVKGSDLNVVDTDKYDYIMTYSFPCQDLSKAGKGKGMSDTTTRSGLLWEVERILTEMKEKPQLLLMENVPDVIGTRYISDFRIWEERLRELGYSNHIEILNSKDYGIPQNRQRAFMVSILGDFLYEFPQKQELTLRLKDMLEKEVDEKYYLTTEKIEAISQWKAQQDPLENMEHIDKTGISPTLTARGAGEEHSGMVLIKEQVFKSKDKRLVEMLDKIDYETDEPQSLDLYNRTVSDISQTLTMPNHNSQAIAVKEFANYITWEDDKGRINTQDHRAYFEDRLSGTVPAMERGVPNVLLNESIAIPEDTTQGYALAHEGDGVYINRPEQKRGVVQKQMIQTIKANSNDVGVVVKEEIIIGSTQKNAFVGSLNGHAPSLTSAMGAGGGHTPMITNNLRIRKLTPRECYRLMGFGDEAFDLAQPNQSNSSLYHQAGDSIVVNVLMAIFKELL